MGDVLVRTCTVEVVLPRPWGWERRDRLSQLVLRYVIEVLLPELLASWATSGTQGRIEQVGLELQLPAHVLGGAGPDRGSLRSMEVAARTKASVAALSYRAVTSVGEPAADGSTDVGALGAPGRPPRHAQEAGRVQVAGERDDRWDAAACVAALFHAMARRGRLAAVLLAASGQQRRRWEELLRAVPSPDVVPAAAEDTPASRRPPAAGEVAAEIARVRSSMGGVDPSVVRLATVFELTRRTGAHSPSAVIWAAVDAAFDQFPGHAVTDGSPAASTPPETAGDRDRATPTSPQAIAAGGLPVPRTSTQDRPPTARAPSAERSPTTGIRTSDPLRDAPRDRHGSSPTGRRDANAVERPRGDVTGRALPFLLLGPLDDVGVLDAIGAALAGVGMEDDVGAYAFALARKVLDPPLLGWLSAPTDEATASAFAGRHSAVGDGGLDRLAQCAADWSPAVDAVIRAELVDGHRGGAPLVVTDREDGAIVADSDGTFPIMWSATAEDVRQLRAQLDQPLVIGEPDAAEVRRLHAVADALAARPALPQRSIPVFEHHVGLCAALALGTIAWRLWRDLEATSPVLAIERFADLDAVVRFGDDVVEVRLPLGRRHADLRDAGLLRPVTGVPWLGGRVVELVGG